MNINSINILLLIQSLFSIAIFFLLKKIKKQKIKIQKIHLINENYQRNYTKYIELEKKYINIKKELEIQKKNNINKELELKEIKTRLEETRNSFKEKEELLKNNENKIKIQFENLANQIFEKNNNKYVKENEKNLIHLLIPFREQLSNFKNQICENFNKEEHQYYKLSYEINELKKLNNKITQETVNLTKALKGDNKIQGTWGETILSRILENSGLRNGHEFKTQVNINSLDRRSQPDVIIYLPQNKNIVIDSKISLKAYEKYFNSENEEIKKHALKEHIYSIKNHIKELGKKDYQELPGLNTLDYVLMFISIESAYLLALNEAPELIDEGLKNNILLVCPSTLLIIIRTINNLWCYENQNQNSKIISERASKIYDKIRLLVDDMQILGQTLNKTQLHYQSIIKKLAEGKGNLINQTENLKKLGIRIKRPINSEFLDQIIKSN
ncbi:MAG: DNA recombination protein RmuC [Arsenophonus sp.]|nr:MAG: DNA recombination protein RmuC [Arsenophonus sp.]